MAEPLVVSALVRKRAEIAGEIEAAVRRLARLRAELTHIDATLRIFDPTGRPGDIGPKLPVRRMRWFAQGELARRTLDALRTAREPLTAREITRQIMAAKGLDGGDAGTLELIAKCVGAYLKRRRDGLIEAVPGQDGGGVRWRVR